VRRVDPRSATKNAGPRIPTGNGPLTTPPMLQGKRRRTGTQSSERASQWNEFGAVKNTSRRRPLPRTHEAKGLVLGKGGEAQKVDAESEKA